MVQGERQYVSFVPLVLIIVGSNEDDLTVKLAEIIFTNALIREHLNKGISTASLMVSPPEVDRPCLRTVH